MQQLPELQQSLFEAMLWECGAEAVAELIHKGADPNYVDPNLGRTPLYSGCVSDRVRSSEELLKHGADPNKRFNYRSPVDGRSESDVTAIMYAVSPEVVSVLIRSGAQVNIGDANGTTPLMRAAFYGRPAVAKLLLEAGADPSCRKAKTRGHKSQTARELAESKLEFFTRIKSADTKTGDSVVQRYDEVTRILIAAEGQFAALPEKPVIHSRCSKGSGAHG